MGQRKLVGSGKDDLKRDGKTPAQRSAAAKKAAATRKRRRGDKVRFTLVIPKKILAKFEETLVTNGGFSSTNEAILTAMRRQAGLIK